MSDTPPNHVVIDVPSTGKSVAKEAIEYRVGPPVNYTFYYHRRNYRLVMWGEQLDTDTLRRLGDACHDLEMEHKDMGFYEDARSADKMEGAFIFENKQKRYLKEE